MKKHCLTRLARWAVGTSLLVAAIAAIAVMPGTTRAQGDFKILYNFGLERGDYRDFDLSRPVWEDCRNACAVESACLSFTYTIPIAGENGRPAHCWLKNVVPRGEGRDWCISGIRQGSTGGGEGCGGGSGFYIQAPSYAASGTRISVSFGTQGPKPTGQSHWIGLMRAGTNAYVEWYWVKDVSGCGTTFAAPSPGNYEFRYYLDGSYDKVAARSPITVQ